MRSAFFAVLLILTGATAMADGPTAHDFAFDGIDGAPMPLAAYRGKVMLVVNTASECGYTGQYEGLEALHKSYGARGLVVVGVPSNQFGGQEPGSAEEIKTFCELNYGVTFPLADKTDVKGATAHPFYQWAGTQAGLLGRPKWNFHKYLIGKDGRFIDWFSTATKPQDDKITSAIEAALE